MSDIVRVLPEPHRYAVCAPEDVPIIDFYRGIYEAVFIFYHPFIRPVTRSYELFMPESYPGKNEIIEHCEKVTWEQFQQLSGIKSIRQLDVGLRTRISGLKEHLSDKETGRLIGDTCDKYKLIVPTEGFFPEFIMNDILSEIKRQGHNWIWCGDEFCTERKLEYIDDLIQDNNALRNQHLNLFTHNNEMLLTTHWDSFFSMLCSDKHTVGKIVSACNLEGFYCDDGTKIYWSTEHI